MKSLVNALFIVMSCYLLSCSSHNDPSSSEGSGTMALYGIEHPMTSASLWHFNPNSSYIPVEYLFIDKYQTDNGESKTDTIRGKIVGPDHISSGKFVLSLYGEGCHFNPDLRVPTGRGSVLTIHFASSDMDRLVAGTYKVSDLPRPQTVMVYASSEINFSSNEKVNPVRAQSGTVEVAFGKDQTIRLSFDLTMTTKATLKGTYQGRYTPVTALQDALVTYKGLSFYGFREKAETTETFFGSTKTKTAPDYKAKSFLSLSSAQLFSASDLQKKFYAADIACYYNQSTSQFEFKSPIVMRPYTGRLSVLDFLSYTKMMLAPSTFTDQDYDNLDKTGVTFEVKDSPVTFAVDAHPYIFAQTYTGEIAVIKILSSIPSAPYVNSQFNGMWVIKGISAPGLKFEYKIVAQYKAPRIL